MIRSLIVKNTHAGPTRPADRLNFLRDAKYNIGGMSFSLFDVSHIREMYPKYP